MEKPVLLMIVTSVVLLSTFCAFGQAPAESPVPSSDNIRQILAGRIGPHTGKLCIVAGVIEPGGRRVVAVGSAGENRGEADGDTVFEIGSITKVFTSLVLADMVEDGEVALDDPVEKYLPSQAKMPKRNGVSITLQGPCPASFLVAPSSGKPRCGGGRPSKSLRPLFRRATLCVSFRL